MTKNWWIWIVAIGALVVIGMLAEKQYDIFATLPVGQTYHDGACTFISNTNIGTDGEGSGDFSSSSTSWIVVDWDNDGSKEGYGYYGYAWATSDACANKGRITYTPGGLRVVKYDSGTSYKEVGICQSNGQAVYRFRNTDPDAADAVLTCTTCTPATCSSLGKTCGSWSNNCGGTLSCGSCSTGYTCQSGTCVSSGGCTSGQTQSCTASNGCTGTQTCSSGAWGTCTTSLQKCSDGSCKTSCGGGTCPTFTDLINKANLWSSCSQDISNPPTESNYYTYLNNNPNVKTAFNSLDSSVQTNFWGYINMLESSGNIPPSSYSSSQLESIKVAYSVYIDNHRLVSWKLNDYSTEEISIIFNIDNSVFTDDTIYAWNYAKRFIKTSKEQTIYSIMDDLRKDFRHCFGILCDDITCVPSTDCDKPWTLRGHLEDRDKDGYRVSKHGCHSMSAVLASLLTSVNIPAYKEKGWFDGTGHASVIISNFGFLMHGDHMYFYKFTDKTSSQILMDWNYFKTQVKPCNSYTSCSKVKIEEYMATQGLID